MKVEVDCQPRYSCPSRSRILFWGNINFQFHIWCHLDIDQIFMNWSATYYNIETSSIKNTPKLFFGNLFLATNIRFWRLALCFPTHLKLVRQKTSPEAIMVINDVILNQKQNASATAVVLFFFPLDPFVYNEYKKIKKIKNNRSWLVMAY